MVKLNRKAFARGVDDIWTFRGLRTWLFRWKMDRKYPGVFDWSPLTDEDHRRTEELAERFGWGGKKQDD